MDLDTTSQNVHQATKPTTKASLPLVVCLALNIYMYIYTKTHYINIILKEYFKE